MSMINYLLEKTKKVSVKSTMPMMFNNSKFLKTQSYKKFLKILIKNSKNRIVREILGAFPRLQT